MAATLPATERNELCRYGCSRLRAPGRKSCTACLEKKRSWNKQLYRERAERGQCVYCALRSEVGIFCFDHWLKNVGVPHGLGNKQGITLLKELWGRQRGLCAVTFEPLVPGLNASLDHIVPKSRGGSNDKENLRWVLLRVNQIKWDMTHEEFVEMCRKVVRAESQHNRLANTNYTLSERIN